jgi:4-amino-4-deoxy-L-arabinose transferase-like glycosyltransferase
MVPKGSTPRFENYPLTMTPSQPVPSTCNKLLRILQSSVPWLPITVLLILGVVVLTKGIDEPPLIDWDEATYAEVAHEALISHSYANFSFNGEKYLKKPPLLFWTLAASFEAFGESEFSARLPSVVMGTGTLLLMYGTVATEFGCLGGLLAGLVPLEFYFFVSRGGRECATDAPLIFFSTLAIFALGRARWHRAWLPVTGLACGLALLSKGAAGLIPLSVVAIAMFAIPGFTEFGTTGLVITAAVTIVIAAPWFAYQLIHDGSAFWSVYVKHETLMRIAKHLEDRAAEANFTAHTMIWEVRHLWPLLLPLAGLAWAAWRERGWAMLRCIPPLVRVWLLWFAVAFTAAFVVQTKLGWYVLPSLIPFALVSAATIAGALTPSQPAGNYCRPLAVSTLVLLALTAVPQQARIESEFAGERQRSRPSYEMAMRAVAFAAVRGGGELYFAGKPLPTTVYYSGMRCHFVSASEPDFELADLGGNPISVSYDELVLRDPGGMTTAIDNYDEEWNTSAPPSERAHPSAPQAPASPAQDTLASPE